MDKIKKINDNLENYELFTPPPNSSNYKLEDFNEILADEVKKNHNGIEANNMCI